MAGIRDLDIGSIACAFNLPTAMKLKELRMQRPPIQLKNKLGNSRANG
jgi:hypothetical protein